MGYLRNELIKLRYSTGVTSKVVCTKEESAQCNNLKKNNQPLPENIASDSAGSYMRYEKTDLSKEELAELFLYRQTSYLYTIKKSMVFFVVLTTISILINVILLYLILNMLP